MRKTRSVTPIALVGIIAILTIFAAGTQPKAFIVGELAQYILPALLTLYLLVLLYHSRVIADILASFFLGNRKRESSSGGAWTIIVGYFVAIILGLLLIKSSMIQNLLGSFAAAISGASAAFKTNQFSLTQSAGAASSPLFFYYVVLIFVAIVLVSFTLLIRGLHTAYIWAKEEHTHVSEKAARRGALNAVQTASKNLRVRGDYRDIIVNCYREMCGVLSLRGMTIGTDETASEFASKIAERLRLGADTVRGLTTLFEEARYSDHPIDDAKRLQAVNELENLERTLKAEA